MGTLSLDLEKGFFLGIDFGTTNSVVSIYNFKNGEIKTIPIDGSNIFPTVIQFEIDPENKNKLSKIFGIQAKEAAIIYPENTILSIKRFLGTDKSIKIKIENKEYKFKPEQIAGEILKYLKQKATEYVQEELNLNVEFSGCVITVPANSTDKQKKMTKKAGILAGFDENNIYLRLEPAAAAISYAINETNNKKILVYDFGGGTFDACILEVKIENEKEPDISILSTFGDNNLGGNDIDKIIMDIIYEEFKKIVNNEIDLFDFSKDDGISKNQKQIAIIKLQQISNQAKERLSKSKNTKIVLAPFIQESKIINLDIEITREKFLNHKRINKLGDSDEQFEKFKNKNLIDIINMTFKCIDKCINNAKIKEDDINEIFLVGGSSSIIHIGEKIYEKFNKHPYKSRINPALSISQGAAYYCSMIVMPTVKTPIFREKTIHPIGLEISGRRFMEIVKAGIEIPKDGLKIECEELLMTNFDNITSMAIIVFEDTLPTNNNHTKFVNQEGMKRLGGTSLRNIPQAPRGEEKVKVIFNISQDNILRVTAKSISKNGIKTNLSVDELYK